LGSSVTSSACYRELAADRVPADRGERVQAVGALAGERLLGAIARAALMDEPGDADASKQ